MYTHGIAIESVVELSYRAALYVFPFFHFVIRSRLVQMVLLKYASSYILSLTVKNYMKLCGCDENLDMVSTSLDKNLILVIVSTCS